MTRFLIACALVLTFSGCEESNELMLPGKVGPAGELLVVVDDALWEGPIGDAIEEVTGRPYDLLPQYEPEYSLSVINRKSFDRFFKPHRNILFVDMDDRIDTQEPSLKMYRDKYASGQLFIEVKGKTPQAIADIITLRGNEMLSALDEEELKRVGDLVRTYPNLPLSNAVMDKFGFTMDFPRDAFLAKETGNFVWINRELTRMKGGNNHDIKQGWFMYTYPYDNDSVFSFDWLVAKRDEMLKAHVPGDIEGSYMQTQMKMIPTYEEKSFKGQFSSQIRGLWTMENDFMGGPFFSMTVYDEPNQRIVTVEGYAYAPYFDKREYIREVEAVVKSLKFKSK